MDFTFAFLEFFFYITYLVFPLLFFMSALILILGLIVARLEGWTPFTGFYWAFITATTVGYGDIRPLLKRSRCLALIIAFIGIVFTGITVAIAIQSASTTFKIVVDDKEVQKKIDRLKTLEAHKYK